MGCIMSPSRHFCLPPGNNTSDNVFYIPMSAGSFHPRCSLNHTRSHLTPTASINFLPPGTTSAFLCHLVAATAYSIREDFLPKTGFIVGHHLRGSPFFSTSLKTNTQILLSDILAHQQQISERASERMTTSQSYSKSVNIFSSWLVILRFWCSCNTLNWPELKFWP